MQKQLLLMAAEQLSSKTRLEQKQQFYKQLELALKSEDDEPDPGREASALALRKGPARRNRSDAKNVIPTSTSDRDVTTVVETRKGRSSQQHHNNSTLRKSNSEPLPLLACSDTNAAPAMTSTSKVSGTAAAIPRASGKRKRGSGLDQLSEEQQVFKGLHFYFFPNTDTHPARRMRIGKAVQYGATWLREFDDTVTHVIVDKAMQFALLLKYVRRDSLPLNVTVVSEDWPAECIACRVLLDPKLRQFKVKGYEVQTTTATSLSKQEQSPRLKPAGRAVQTRPPETQRSGGRSSKPLPSETRTMVGNEHIKNSHAPSTGAIAGAGDSREH